MAYEVNKTNGSVLINIQEGEVDSTYGLNLLGKNYLGYGELIAENFVRLLENFASKQEPANPIEGQLWFSVPDDFSTDRPYQLKVYHGTGGWKPVANMFVGSSQESDYGFSAEGPGFSQRGLGDFWFDRSPTVNAVKYWNGTRWVNLSMLIGGTNPDTQTGLIVDETIKDTNGTFHKAIKFKVSGVLVAIFSSDNAYTPAPASQQTDGYDYTEFCGGGASEGDPGDYNEDGKIGKGINLNASSDFKIRGVAVEAEFADVAEIYVGDAAYEPGTLVGLGGSAEVTSTKGDADQSVFGVVSYRPAYLMNARKKHVKNAIPIAVAGRIPVKVIGPVKRGDRLVASDIPGVARSATEQDSIWSVIGRALQDYTGEGIGKIESSVGAR